MRVPIPGFSEVGVVFPPVFSSSHHVGNEVLVAEEVLRGGGEVVEVDEGVFRKSHYPLGF